MTCKGIGEYRAITLTTGTDNLTGTSGNDTFLASGDGSGVSYAGTYQSADSIDGAGGTDTLSVTVAGDISAQIPVIKNIEILQARATAAGSKMDASAGYETIKNVGSTKDMTFDAIAKNAALVVENVTDDTTFTFASGALASTTATLDLQLSGAATKAAPKQVNLITAGTDSVTTINVAATGANYIQADDTGTQAWDSVKTINVTGAGSLKIDSTGAGAALDAVTKIDASANTGGVTVDLASGANAQDVTFLGGSGNDTVAFAAGSITTVDSLDGGEGSNTLSTLDDTLTNAANAQVKGINAAKNFGTLQLAATSTASATGQVQIGMDVINIASIKFSGANVGANGNAESGSTAATAGSSAIVVTNQANSDSFAFSADQTGGDGGAGDGSATGNGAAGASAVTINALVDNGSNSLDVSLSGVTLTGGNGGALAGGGTQGNGGNGLLANDFETVNIVSTGATATAVNELKAGTGASDGAGIVVADNATINVSGANELKMGVISGASGATNITLNAAELTGKLTAVLLGGNDTVTGGSSNNTLTLGGGVDAVDLSNSVAKNDTINVNLATGTDATTGKLITLTGFTNSASTSVADKLDFRGATAVDVQGTKTGTDGTLGYSVSSKGLITFTGESESTTFAQYLAAAAHAVDTANKAGVFEYNGDSYVYVEVDGDTAYDAGTDYVVKLAGVTGLDGLATAAGANTVFIA